MLSGFLGKIFGEYQIPYTVIPNVIELDGSLFRLREQLRPDFISIRTLSPLYNIECVLRAFKQVKRQIPEATLTIVGDGPSRESLEKMVADDNIQDVCFTGRVDNREIYKYIDKADIMFSAPRIDNMPVSLLEAFNAGLLVISSNVGGVPYMIEDGVNGLLFKSDDDKELAEKMMWAVTNPKAVSMIENAHCLLNNYQWKEVFPKIHQLYK